MRKIIMQEWLSADGYAADSKGTTAFFEDVRWTVDSDQDILAQMDSIDTILLGANTYRLFVDYWPTVDPGKEIIANRLNQTRKLVFSSTLEEVNWGKWHKPELIKTDAITAIKKLKNEYGQNIVLWGSLSLAQSLLDAQLIDEIEIRTLPVILGKGLRLFANSGKINLQTIGTRKYDSGVTLVHYRVCH